MAAACRGSLRYPSKGCCSHHVPLPCPSQLYLRPLLGECLPRAVSPALTPSTGTEHRGVLSSQTLQALGGAVPFLPLLVPPPLPRGSSCPHCQSATSSCPACPHHRPFPPQPSPAACRWTRATASATRCAGTTTKESPSAAPSSTAAARATSTALTARRSASCTAGSAQGQVGMAGHGRWHRHCHLGPWAWPTQNRLSSEAVSLHPAGAHGVAGGEAGEQPKA